MNPIQDLIAGFQELVAQVPELLQPFIVMLAGMIPFIEGEGGAAIGIIGGIHPLIAAIAAAVGNFLAVLAIVLLTSRTRDAVVARRDRGATGDDGTVLTLEGDEETQPAGSAGPAKPESKGRQRFNRWLVRFGVPGASLLGPLAIPTHFTAATLVASGVARGWVLLWQAIAIVLWTTIVTVPLWLVISAVAG
ncbi:small multidrug efflux protein [Agrococcus sp. Marseille-P2731]|uniref:small multidrug efflux protein n=1 Tax=Agrococcus sp. Marseille-P2731 TaxID=1841862 RepID=UPI0009305815|nr:small multidrug efflux protein [Agrococcus sp. Marseille-P2731]